MRASALPRVYDERMRNPSRIERSMRLMLLAIKIVSLSTQLIRGAAENASRVSLLSQTDTVDLPIPYVVYCGSRWAARQRVRRHI